MEILWALSNFSYTMFLRTDGLFQLTPYTIGYSRKIDREERGCRKSPWPANAHGRRNLSVRKCCKRWERKRGQKAREKPTTIRRGRRPYLQSSETLYNNIIIPPCVFTPIHASAHVTLLVRTGSTQ